jgi:hypothetical protein
MRDVDVIIETLTQAHPHLQCEQLKVVHPGADDDGLWFFRHPSIGVEVQLESPHGACPFLFESDATALRITASTVSEAVRFVEAGLGLCGGKGPN